jgi:hypothetical protein
MTPNDHQQKNVAAALAGLRLHDVGPARAERLRARCHTALARQAPSRRLAGRGRRGVPRAVQIVAAAWCFLYVFETLRRAAAVYGL